MPNSILRKLLLVLINPGHLLAGILFYALGAGVANYLGYSIDWLVYIIGQVIISSLQICGYFLKSIFDLNEPNLRKYLLRDLDLDISPQEFINLQRQILLLAFSVLTAAIATSVVLYSYSVFNVESALFLSVLFIMMFLFAAPPFRLAYSGFGELILGFIIVNTIPAIAYTLQTSMLHRFILFLTFPILALYVSMLLVQSLLSYGEDVKYFRMTMMIKLGWQNGMIIHNVLILLAYLFLVISMLYGMPLHLILPALLTIPIGFFQIYLLLSISRGKLARLSLLKYLSILLVGLTAYLITFSLWVS